MEGLGYPDIDIVISATGWLTAGGVGASVTNAFKYNQGLVNKVIESPNVGTPHCPKRAVPAFLHGLADNGEDGLRWGVFNEDGSMAYPLQVWQSTEAGCVPAQSPARSPAKSPHNRRVPAGDGDGDVLAPVPWLDEEDDGEDGPVSSDDDYAAPAPAPEPIPVYAYDDSGAVSRSFSSIVTCLSYPPNSASFHLAHRPGSSVLLCLTLLKRACSRREVSPSFLLF
ncbi:hypothetical protein L7F22_009989 [Adiantum nelumboides]|nr:hypothetical protein [Adiantum nelumboides]